MGLEDLEGSSLVISSKICSPQKGFLVKDFLEGLSNSRSRQLLQEESELHSFEEESLSALKLKNLALMKLEGDSELRPKGSTSISSLTVEKSSLATLELMREAAAFFKGEGLKIEGAGVLG